MNKLGRYRVYSGLLSSATRLTGRPVLRSRIAWEFSEVLDVNLQGLFHCAKAFDGLIVLNDRGKIINMASVFRLIAMERQGAYASSKGPSCSSPGC
jgi:NAD(P)-dependent dehydrogenase (short-subunit alcohol dehydrogenase family)